MSKPSKKTYGKFLDSLHWSKYDIPYNQIFRTNKFKSCPHTSIMQCGNFSHIQEQRHLAKNYNQPPFQFVLRKNAQLLSEYIICILCLKSGHLAHECRNYEPKAHQSNSHESSTMSLSPKMNDSSDINNDNMFKDNSNTTQKYANKALPIVLVKSLINKRTSNISKNKNKIVDNNISTLNYMVDFVNIYHLKDRSDEN